MSKGENKIIDLLNKENVCFEREKTFHDLKHGKFRFDFYLPYTARGPVLIEYDGEQHFHYIGAFYRARAEWEKAKEHDRQKNSYCLANDIKLYRIPYWEIKNIKSVGDLLNPKFLVQNRWHNDRILVPNL